MLGSTKLESAKEHMSLASGVFIRARAVSREDRTSKAQLLAAGSASAQYFEGRRAPCCSSTDDGTRTHRRYRPTAIADTTHATNP
jgi:hypothetical protein